MRSDEDYPASKGQLGHRETAVLLIIAISARVFLGFPRVVSSIGGTAGWLAVTFSFLAAALGYVALDRLLARFPDSDLIGVARRLLGPLAYPFGLVFFLFFLADTALVARQFAETFVIGILPRTPIGVITAMLLILLVTASYLGIETISRLAMLYGPYILLFVLLIFASVSPHARILNLTPLWGRGVAAIFGRSLTKSSLFAEIAILGFLAPTLRDRSRRAWVGGTAMLGSYLVMLLSALVFTMVFGYPGTTRLFFPIYQLARLVTLMEFFQRVEAIFVFLWVFVAAIALSAFFYVAAYAFARTFSLSSHRPLLFPLVILVYSLSLLPASFPSAIRLDADYLHLYGWIPAFLFPAVLLSLSLIRGQKGGDLV